MRADIGLLSGIEVGEENEVEQTDRQTVCRNIVITFNLDSIRIDKSEYSKQSIFSGWGR